MPQPLTTFKTRTLTTKKGRSIETNLSDAEAISSLRNLRGDFAQELAQKSYSGLSADQIVWAHILAIEALGANNKVEKIADDDSVANILRLFLTAKQHLKYPKIRLVSDGLPITLSMTGDNSRYPGCVNVTDGDGFENNTWYGRIEQDGTFTKSRSCPLEVIGILKRFARNPAEVAAEYGHLTGNCCFCLRALTDKRSTDVGYGKTCASHYSLPWGALK